MLSQLVSSPESRLFLRRQLEEWHRTEALSFINRNRLKVFAICAGQLVLPSLDLVAYQGVDWKRTLGMHMWYQCQPTDLIGQAIEAFESSCTTFGSSVVFNDSYPYPLPAYSFSKVKVSKDRKSEDVCFRLLKLYASTASNPYELESVLVPEATTPFLLDSQLSWSLLSILQNTTAHNIPDDRQTQLHIEFADLLESVGLWYWSAFVLQHISSTVTRMASITSLINRNSHKITASSRSHLLRFGVFDELIERSLAHFAKYEGRYLDQVSHLINADLHDQAYHVLLTDVLPNVVKLNSLPELVHLSTLLERIVHLGMNLFLLFSVTSSKYL